MLCRDVLQRVRFSNATDSGRADEDYEIIMAIGLRAHIVAAQRAAPAGLTTIKRAQHAAPLHPALFA